MIGVLIKRGTWNRYMSIMWKWRQRLGWCLFKPGNTQNSYLATRSWGWGHQRDLTALRRNQLLWYLDLECLGYRSLRQHISATQVTQLLVFYYARCPGKQIQTTSICAAFFKPSCEPKPWLICEITGGIFQSREKQKLGKGNQLISQKTTKRDSLLIKNKII